MSDPFDIGADVFFHGKDLDWRDELAKETDPDDEVLDETPEDVVAILGFDPLEEDETEASPASNNPDLQG